MSNEQPKETENKESEDYLTSLLKQCYKRIPKEKQSECLNTFYSALTTDKPPADLPTEVDENMFVTKLRPLLKSKGYNLFDTHRKLATATYRLLNNTAADEQKNDIVSVKENISSSLRFDLDASTIKSLAKEIQTEVSTVMDGIAGYTEKKDLTTKNVLVPLIQLDQRMSGVENCVTFLQNVSPSKDVRDASNEAEIELSKFFVEVSMRKDVYKVLKSYSENIDTSTLNAEWKRYLEHELRDYRRNGLDLDDANYEKVKEMKKRMSELGSKFSKNLNEEDTSFIMEEKELNGMTDDFKKARLITDDKDVNKGKYHITIKYPDLFPILRQCKVDETRQKMLIANNSRCISENTPIMEELVKLRYKQAVIMGKKNHSDYRLEIRMAKNAKTVWDFLHDLNEKMEPIFKKDMEALLALKKCEKEEMNEKFDGVMNEYDFRYYTTMREEKEFSIDKESLRDYFPMRTVVDGALNIYQTLLSLKFVQINESQSQFKFWHSDVELYQVMDTDTNELQGYFFLDLYPRKGKYGHACKITLQTGCRIYDDDGMEISKQLPINVMLCNFPKATDDKPSLLSHDDVVTFFHEFGHVMHQICGQTLLSRFAGTAVERDFVEAPSQMLENWCWKSESLNLMSGHWKDCNQKIANDVIDKLAKSKNANCGILTKRQLYFGILDQTMHTCQDENGVDTAKLCRELQPKIMGIDTIPNTNFVASFGHLAGGYDAQYYGYMYSEVFSADMFQTVFNKNDDALLNPKNGKNYRQKILAPGGSRDAIESLKDFLGREPNNDAFLKEKLGGK